MDDLHFCRLLETGFKKKSLFYFRFLETKILMSQTRSFRAKSMSHLRSLIDFTVTTEYQNLIFKTTLYVTMVFCAQKTSQTSTISPYFFHPVNSIDLTDSNW